MNYAVKHIIKTNKYSIVAFSNHYKVKEKAITESEAIKISRVECVSDSTKDEKYHRVNRYIGKQIFEELDNL